jgi:hypothetical protein
MENNIYNKYANNGNSEMQRFKAFNQIDSLAGGDITKYDSVLNIDYGIILIHTDLHLQRLAIEERERKLNNLKNK